MIWTKTKVCTSGRSQANPGKTKEASQTEPRISTAQHPQCLKYNLEWTSQHMKKKKLNTDSEEKKNQISPILT